MQWEFSVHERGKPEIARITYDWDADKFSGVLSKDVPVDLFHFPWEWVEQIKNDGAYELTDEQIRMWVSYRIVPASRHNIGEILRDLGLLFWHECLMMRYVPGCHSDAFITEFISGEDVGLCDYDNL